MHEVGRQAETDTSSTVEEDTAEPEVPVEDDATL